ncbi:MAG: PEGA domain-containing protein [Ignavibacteria bacterium]|nr:PEGA domain-containing protein [Ignavibacteria bacterium]
MNYKYYLLTLIVLLLFNGCDKEVSQTPTAPPPSEGFIFVNSNPHGFAIYQNGRNTGRFTPDSLTFLEPDDYEITLKKLYWKDTSVVVNVIEEEPSSVDIDYLSNPSMFGDLIFFSIPIGAQIIINDSLINKTTPDTLYDLLPGKYNVIFRLQEHREEMFEAIVESGIKKNYNAALRDTSVWVDFQVFNSGIQSNVLSAIALDQNDVKWIGSLTIGAISFDDNEFINYNEMNSPLPDNKVNCISVDPQNKVWIGTDFGVAVFDRFNWTIYNRENSGLTSEVINSIKFDDNGNVWIGTSSGLVKFDGVEWQIFNDSELRIWAMDCDFDDTDVKWIGTKREGIFTLENETLVFIPDSIFNYPTLKISSVARDGVGNIWFSHMPDGVKRSGVSFWDGSIFNNTFLGSPINNVNHINIDVTNNKWVSTWQGFVWFDVQNLTQTFTELNSLISSNITNSSVRDQNGVVWITTQGSGLNKFKVNNLK